MLLIAIKYLQLPSISASRLHPHPDDAPSGRDSGYHLALLLVLCSLLFTLLSRLATGWTVRGSNPGEGGGTRFSSTVPSAVGPTQPSVQREFFPGVKRPGRGVDHPSPSSARLKKE